MNSVREQEATRINRSEVTAAGTRLPRAPLRWMSREIGNRNFNRSLARMRDGEGVLPSGAVHPQVEAAIRASRGWGRPLDPLVRTKLEDALGEPLSDVRIHTDDRAAALARSVSARAFTVGSDIFFSPNEYNPHGGGDSSALITHEVAHVLQQRGAPLTGPLTVSQPGDRTEVEAEAVARDYAP